MPRTNIRTSIAFRPEDLEAVDAVAERLRVVRGKDSPNRSWVIRKLIRFLPQVEAEAKEER